MRSAVNTILTSMAGTTISLIVTVRHFVFRGTKGLIKLTKLESSEPTSRVLAYMGLAGLTAGIPDHVVMLPRDHLINNCLVDAPRCASTL